MKAEEEEETRQIEMAIKLSLGGRREAERGSDVDQPCSSRSLWQGRDCHSKAQDGEEVQSLQTNSVTVGRHAAEQQANADCATYRVEKTLSSSSSSSRDTARPVSDNSTPSIRSQDELNEEMRRKRLEYFARRDEK